MTAAPRQDGSPEVAATPYFSDVEFPEADPAECQAAEERLRSWGRRYRLTSRDEDWMQLNLGADAAATYPDASPQLVDLHARLTFLITAFHEVTEQAVDGASLSDLNQHVVRLMAVLGNPALVPEGNGFDAALADILRSASAILTPDQRADLHVGLCTLAGLWLWEGIHRTNGTWPTPGDYLTARRHLMVAWLARTLAEPLKSIVITPQNPQYADYLLLKEATCTVMALHNDLASFAKERRAAGGPPFSMPGMLMHHEGRSLDEALARTRKMFDDEAARTAELVQRMTRSPLAEIRAYARNSAFHVCAEDRWYSTQERYE